MFHLIFRSFALLSAILFLILLYAWLRSQHQTDFFCYREQGWFACAETNDDRLELSLMFVTRADLLWSKNDYWDDCRLPEMGWSHRHRGIDCDSLGWVWGFDFDHAGVKFGDAFAGVVAVDEPAGLLREEAYEGKTLILPWGWLTLTAVLLPMIRITLWLHRRHRRRSGRCAVCGYDLRASPGSCPECGAANALAHAIK